MFFKSAYFSSNASNHCGRRTLPVTRLMKEIIDYSLTGVSMMLLAAKDSQGPRPGGEIANVNEA